MSEKIKSMTKGELAEEFGWSTKTLQRRCNRVGIKTTKDKLLTADKVAEILTKVGHYEVDKPDTEKE